MVSGEFKALSFLMLLATFCQSASAQFATELIDFSRADGVPANVLGPPDCLSGVDFDNVGSDPGFVTVGFGEYVVDRSGDDLILYLADFRPVGSIIEGFTFLASEDGSNFVELGSAVSTDFDFSQGEEVMFSFDLAAANLSMARFAKVVNSQVHPGTGSEGSDICGLEAIHLESQPTAVCTDVNVAAGPTCLADASVDGGSFDPEGEKIMILQEPPGPYPLGETTVTLIVDDGRLSDSCKATVTVLDEAAPVVFCNAPPSIVPPDTPLSFVATATDNCELRAVSVTDVDCFMFTNSGKRVDKNESCEIQTERDMLLILDSGGVGNTISWKAIAVDASGNNLTLRCEVGVDNPGRGRR